MPAHKTESEPIFHFDEAYAEMATRMQQLHISRIAEMPRIELYLDQLLSLVDMELAFMYEPNEKIITGPMVNNYVKQGLVPAPKRKRYTRRHLASLLFVCAFKRVLSIAQIAQIRSMCSDADVDVERAYDEVIGEFEQALAARFTTSPNDAPTTPELHVVLVTYDGTPIEGELPHLIESVLSLIANKIYLECLLTLEAKRNGMHVHTTAS